MVWEKLIAWVSFAAVLAVLAAMGGCESGRPAVAEPVFAAVPDAPDGAEDAEAAWAAGYPGLEMPYESVQGDVFLTDEEVLP